MVQGAIEKTFRHPPLSSLEHCRVHFLCLGRLNIVRIPLHLNRMDPPHSEDAQTGLVEFHSLAKKEAAVRMSEVFCQDHARRYGVNIDSAQGDPRYGVKSPAQYSIG